MGNPVRDMSHISLVQIVDDTGATGGITAPVGVALEVTQEGVLTAVEAIQTAAESTAPTLTARAPYTVARPITPNTNVAAGQGVLIVCTVAGNQVLELSSGNTITVAVAVGTSFIDNLAVIDAPSSGTTATATVTVLAVS